MLKKNELIAYIEIIPLKMDITLMRRNKLKRSISTGLKHVLLLAIIASIFISKLCSL